MSHDAALSKPQPQAWIDLVLLQCLQQAVKSRLWLTAVQQLNAEVVQDLVMSRDTHVCQHCSRQQVRLCLI